MNWRVPECAAVEWAGLQLAVAVHGGGLPCEADPEGWFSSRATPALAAAQDAAAEACAGCVVLVECRGFALASGQRYGVWGGLRPGDRRQR